MSIELWAARLERPLTERETADMLRLLPAGRRERLLRIYVYLFGGSLFAPISSYAWPCGRPAAGRTCRRSG